MKKKIIGGFILSLSLIMTVCGSSGGSSIQGNSISETTENVIAAEIPKLKDWRVIFPDDSWHKEYKSGLDTLELYKDGCYDSMNSSITVFTENMNAEESMIGSKDLSASFSESVMKDLDYEVGGVDCPAYEQYQSDYDKTIVKVFYPLSRKKSIQINIFVSKGRQQGIDPYSDEVKQIIQSIVDENGLLSAAAAEEGPSDIERIEINEEGLSFEGKTVETEDFSVIVPDGWQLFESSYGTKYVIKGGTDLEDYESKPFIRMYYDDKDASTYCISEKKYHDDCVDLTVDICGTECPAIRYKDEMASKSVYWDHLKVFMPVSNSESISFEIITDSSEFEGVDIADDAVRQIIISVQKSMKKP